MWVTLLAVIVVYILWRYINKEDNPVDSIPGPPKLPIFGDALRYLPMGLSERFSYDRQLAKTYKDRHLIKIFHRRIVCIYNPQDIEIVLSHSRNITKNKPYEFMRPWLGYGLLMSTGSKWHKIRKILTPTFHFEILKTFANLIEDRSRRLVEKLKVTNEEFISILPIMSDHTLYTICETAMGTKLDADITDKSTTSSAYKDAIINISSITVDRLARIWLYNDTMFWLSEMGKTYAKNLDIINTLVDKVIRERQKQRLAMKQNEIEETKKLALLDLLLEAEAKGEIDLEGIRSEVNTFIFAGHDTTGTALTFALMLLSDREDIQELIYKEYRQIMSEKDTPSLSDFADMKYLDAVIKEVLRMYSNPYRIGRLLTEEITLGGVKLKPGTEVAVLMIDLHRREDLFPEPDVFRPERFLNGELKHPYSFVPFSAGPRNCLGQKFAMIELKSALSHICNNFRLVPLKKGWRAPTITTLMLRPTEPIYVKFVPRQ